jgi:hypothetical protein
LEPKGNPGTASSVRSMLVSFMELRRLAETLPITILRTNAGELEPPFSTCGRETTPRRSFLRNDAEA